MLQPDQSDRTRPQRRVLLGQSAVLLLCAVLVGQWAWDFPYPAPVVRPFLSPQDRWPEDQIREWATTSTFRDDYWQFFTRDPERSIPPGDNLVAPADGLLRYHDVIGDRQYLVIAMSFWDVHVQRSPCDAIVTGIRDAGTEFRDGEGTDLAYLKEKLRPVQKILTLATRHGQIEVRLVTSLSARRLETFVEVGDRVAKGDRIGRILAGSTVVLDLPTAIPVAAKVNQRLLAGATILTR